MESNLNSDTTKCTNFFLWSPYLHNYNLPQDDQETYLIKSSVQSRLNVQVYETRHVNLFVNNKNNNNKTSFRRVLEILTYL